MYLKICKGNTFDEYTNNLCFNIKFLTDGFGSIDEIIKIPLYICAQSLTESIFRNNFMSYSQITNRYNSDSEFTFSPPWCTIFRLSFIIIFLLLHVYVHFRFANTVFTRMYWTRYALPQSIYSSFIIEFLSFPQSESFHAVDLCRLFGFDTCTHTHIQVTCIHMCVHLSRFVSIQLR